MKRYSKKVKKLLPILLLLKNFCFYLIRIIKIVNTFFKFKKFVNNVLDQYLYIYAEVLPKKLFKILPFLKKFKSDYSLTLPNI